jgi:CBS domain-containing protein
MGKTDSGKPLTGRIELHTWHDFMKVMETMQAGRWIYRGHEDATWRLESGLDRYLKQFGKAGLRKGDGGSRDVEFLDTFPRAEFFAISRFQAMSREYEKWENDVEALIAMQHYGAKTRLLDFTTSIMVALFFAYENQANGKKRAIYAINFGSLIEQNGVWNRYKKFLETIVKRVNSGDEQARWMSESQIENQYFREFAFAEAAKWFGENVQDDDIDIIPLYTVCSNKRQMAQSGVELMPRTFDWFDKNLARALKVSIKEVNDPSYSVSDNISEEEDVGSLFPTHLVKLVFDPQMEKEAWQFLDQANINAASIYPDLVGIAKSTRYNNNTVVIGNELGDAKESEPVLNFWISQKNLIACSLSDTISSVIDKMVVKGISHVPVLDEEGKVIGIFSESTMMEAWKAKLNCPKAATMNGLADLLPMDKHKLDVFEFVPQNASAAGLWNTYKESLENDKRIGLFLVTENGNKNEPLLGIATAWDVAEALDEKGNDNKEIIQ